MSIEQLDTSFRDHVGRARPYLRLVEPRADLDVCLEEIAPGRCVFTAWVVGSVTASASLVNGGLCSTLADLAMAAAIQSTLEPGTGYRIVCFGIDINRGDTTFHGLLEARGEAHDEGSDTTSATAPVDVRGAVRAEPASRCAAAPARASATVAPRPSRPLAPAPTEVESTLSFRRLPPNHDTAKDEP